MLGLEFAESVLWKSPGVARMEKIHARAGCSSIVGVRPRSNELIIVDRETNGIKYVRTVNRLEQQWLADEGADGDVPEFDVKQGPGRSLIPGEMAEIATQDTPHCTHGAFDETRFREIWIHRSVSRVFG